MNSSNSNSNRWMNSKRQSNRPRISKRTTK